MSVKFFDKPVFRNLACCFLVFLGGCSQRSDLTDALDDYAVGRESGLIDHGEAIALIPIGISEEKALVIILGAGFSEIERTSEQRRFDSRPKSAEFLTFDLKIRRWNYFSYRRYMIFLGVTDGAIDQFGSSEHWYIWGIN